MNDSESLFKLVTHIAPLTFHRFAREAFAIELPPLNAKEGKRKQRAALTAALSARTVAERRAMDEVAERIVQLTDGAGQDVIDGIAAEIPSEADRNVFIQLRNQFERALWLYRNAPDLFEEALNARQADVFRQSPNCFSGYIAPKALSLRHDGEAKNAFHTAVAAQIGCPTDAVAVQLFKRLRPDTETGEEVDLYQVSIHHNRSPEAIERVENSELVAQEVVRAVTSHITYEPSNGYLEVLSKHTDGREALARIVANTLLQSPFQGEKIPLKQYDYQCLAAPRFFDITNEPLAWVRVVELGHTFANQDSLRFKVRPQGLNDIYLAAKHRIGPTFDFRHHPLTFARVAIRIQKTGKDRARTVTVILRDDNRCNIKTKRERDRILCDRLLSRWGIIKEIGDDSIHALAA